MSRPVWYDRENGGDDVTAPPTLGEHTEEVLSAFGFGEEIAIAQLRSQTDV